MTFDEIRADFGEYDKLRAENKKLEEDFWLTNHEIFIADVKILQLKAENEKLKDLLMEASKILQLVRTDRVDPLERDFAVDDLWGKIEAELEDKTDE